MWPCLPLRFTQQNAMDADAEPRIVRRRFGHILLQTPRAMEQCLEGKGSKRIRCNLVKPSDNPPSWSIECMVEKPA